MASMLDLKNTSGQSADRALANLCERLMFSPPPRKDAATPEGWIMKISISWGGLDTVNGYGHTLNCKVMPYILIS